MFKNPQDIPLKRDPAGRYLPYIIAILIFFSVLASMAAIRVLQIAAGWQEGVSETYTVQILSYQEEEAGLSQQVLTALKQNVNVSTATLLNEKKLKAMLAPWLGNFAYNEHFTLPVLIDVRMKQNRHTNPEALEAAMKTLSPHISVYSHQQWLQHIVRIFKGFSEFALSIVFLTFLGVFISTIFSVHVSLKAHLHELEVLHIIGAYDSYIARQFATYAQKLVALGALLGTALTVPVFYSLGLLFSDSTFVLGGKAPISPFYWLLSGLPPLSMIIVSRFFAWHTIMRALRRMK